jgi:hypothetical protein
MTANELARNTLVTFDSVFSQSAPGYDDPEISIFLTKAQQIYFFRRLPVFDTDEVSKKALSSLLSNNNPTVSSTQTGSLPTETFYDLPLDCELVMFEKVKTNIPLCTDPQKKTFIDVTVRPIKIDDYNLDFYNPYKKPYMEKTGDQGLVWRLDRPSINNVKIHGLLTDGTFNITDYYISYLRLPKDIVVDFTTPSNQVNPEISSIAHFSIVDIAVMLIEKAIREGVRISDMNVFDLI